MDAQQFKIKWNDFSDNVAKSFDNLLTSKTLTDVSFFCENVTFTAHKLVLAISSKYLANLFESIPPHQHVVIILEGTLAIDIAALIEFMYKGEVHIPRDSLHSFLKSPEYLQIKGLIVEHEKTTNVRDQSKLKTKDNEFSNFLFRSSPIPVSPNTSAQVQRKFGVQQLAFKEKSGTNRITTDSSIMNCYLDRDEEEGPSAEHPEDLHRKPETLKQDDILTITDSLYRCDLGMEETGLIPSEARVRQVLDEARSITATDNYNNRFKCPFCERLYGYKANLRTHIRQHHQRIRVPCPHCSRTFTCNSTVRRHIARNHKINTNGGPQQIEQSPPRNQN